MSSEKLRFYGLKTCSTCRKAKKWLKENGVDFDEYAIRETPPAREELAEYIDAGALKKAMNTSSKDYRERGLSKAELTKEGVLDLFEAVPNLIKRPLVIWPDGATFGFKTEVFAQKLQG